MGSSVNGVNTRGGAQPKSVMVVRIMTMPIQKLGMARPPIEKTRIR